MKITNRIAGVWMEINKEEWLAWKPDEDTYRWFIESKENGGTETPSEAQYRTYRRDGIGYWWFECAQLKHEEIPGNFDAWCKIGSPWE